MLLWDTLLGRSCGTLLQYIFVGILLRGLVRYFCGKLLWHSRGTLLLPPKLTRQVSKTSVSYKTFPPKFTLQVSTATVEETHAPSLQNERFVGDFIQKSRVKSQNKPFCMSLPPNAKSHTSILENNRFVSDFLQIHYQRERSPANTGSQSQPHPLTLQSHATQPRNLTIPCARHENSASTPGVCNKYCACLGK